MTKTFAAILIVVVMMLASALPSMAQTQTEVWRCEGVRGTGWGATLRSALMTEEIEGIEGFGSFEPDTLPPVLTVYELQGIDRVWSWVDGVWFYAFFIEPGGNGGYYSRLVEDIDSMRNDGFFTCTRQ